MNSEKDNKRNIFRTIFGICSTQLPKNDACWTYNDGELVVDMNKTNELLEKGSAIRIEHSNLEERILLVHGDDDRFYAFRNYCTHGKRRLDPVPGAETIQCCSVGKATFNYKGEILRGAAKENIKSFPVVSIKDKIIISLEKN